MSQPLKMCLQLVTQNMCIVYLVTVQKLTFQMELVHRMLVVTIQCWWYIEPILAQRQAMKFQICDIKEITRALFTVEERLKKDKMMMMN